MAKKAVLVLEDGNVYEGISFGSDSTSYGEVVFDTAMAGYQEMLTDPSFAGQIVVPTYPLIGNYGINQIDSESKQIQIRGFVVRENCEIPSHGYNDISLHEYLQCNGIPGISGIDTRALTRRLRSAGVMLGILTSEMEANEALAQLQSLPRYEVTDFIDEVTTNTTREWDSNVEYPVSSLHIAVLDLGLKYNITRILARSGCKISIVPARSAAEEILSLKPDGIVLSPGPGDPALLTYLIETVKKLVFSEIPLLGICLGHQLIGLSLGARTFKMKFGHRGGNHPVRDLETGRIHITTQNHGYVIDPDSLKGGLTVSHVNSNDGTVEGMNHKELPLISIQYHSEGAPGPQDNEYLFERFIEMVKNNR
jgi:carbamoyl-phosphate synthase small subunit